jgi:hypothetical protein
MVLSHCQCSPPCFSRSISQVWGYDWKYNIVLRHSKVMDQSRYRRNHPDRLTKLAVRLDGPVAHVWRAVPTSFIPKAHHLPREGVEFRVRSECQTRKLSIKSPRGRSSQVCQGSWRTVESLLCKRGACRGKRQCWYLPSSGPRIEWHLCTCFYTCLVKRRVSRHSTRIETTIKTDLAMRVVLPPP